MLGGDDVQIGAHPLRKKDPKRDHVAVENKHFFIAFYRVSVDTEQVQSHEEEEGCTAARRGSSS